MHALVDGVDKLKSRGIWDLHSVREWYDVAREATTPLIKKVHVGRICPIVVEANAQLPDGHLNRNYKGRIVLG